MQTETTIMSENTQHKLDAMRPPRVQITFDVMVGNATEQKELPFVVAIIADLSGMRAQMPPPLKDRSFVGIYNDNMIEIMQYIKPSLELSVNNHLLSAKGKLKINLVFESMDDFHPANLIKQIPSLAALHESRVHLKDLLSKMDGNDELEELLLDIMSNSSKQASLWSEIEKDYDAPSNTKQSAAEVLQTLSAIAPIVVENKHEVDVFESSMTPDEPSQKTKDDESNKKNENDDFF